MGKLILFLLVSSGIVINESGATTEVAGPTGATGAPGPMGATGDTGVHGAAGQTGAMGSTGGTGPHGATGSTGNPGATGPSGPTGPTGGAGPSGVIGPVGATGLRGPPGTFIDVCMSYNNNCAHICINTVTGPVCGCRAGYSLDTNGKTCSDTDECSAYNNGGCEHTCINTIGSFRCTCQSGYDLMHNGLSCEQGVTPSVTAILVIYGILIVGMAVSIVVLFCYMRGAMGKGATNNFVQMS